MSKYITITWVVMYNPGWYVRSQKIFFTSRRDSEEWLDSWCKRHPIGSARLHQYNSEDHTILVQGSWGGSARWEPID